MNMVSTNEEEHTMTEMEQIMQMTKDRIYSQFLENEQQKEGMEIAVLMLMLMS